MIQEKQEILDLFKQISEEVHEKVYIYLIGGAAMMFFERKDQTKDIDVVVTTNKEYRVMKKTMENLRFKPQLPTKEYEKFDLSQIYVRGDFRIDIFEKTVCKGFFLSNNIIKRAEKIFENNGVDIFVCSTTDVFLFKTFTQREGNIDDCISLARTNILWEEMLKEIKLQIAHSKKPVWITYIGERLDLLEDKGVQVPIMKEINRLRHKYFVELEKKLK